jgi:hypothetical protein
MTCPWCQNAIFCGFLLHIGRKQTNILSLLPGSKTSFQPLALAYDNGKGSFLDSFNLVTSAWVKPDVRTGVENSAFSTTKSLE